MPVPRNREVHEYAERVRARVPRRFKEVLAASGCTKHKFQDEAGVSKQMLSNTETGANIPGLCVLAQISRAAGLTLTEFVRGLEDDWEA